MERKISEDKEFDNSLVAFLKDCKTSSDAQVKERGESTALLYRKYPELHNHLVPKKKVEKDDGIDCDIFLVTSNGVTLPGMTKGVSHYKLGMGDKIYYPHEVDEKVSRYFYIYDGYGNKIEFPLGTN